ncbi:MAG: hypothetical protein IPJ77_13965 [Planctomycetes bacterium]|nr:hypothetical protein [Planctomycetota bacterium]
MRSLSLFVLASTLVAGVELRAAWGARSTPTPLTSVPQWTGGFNQKGECTNPVRCNRYKFEPPTSYCHYCSNLSSNPYRCNASSLFLCPDYSTGGTACGDEMICEYDPNHPELGCDWFTCTPNGYCTEVDCQ